MRALVTTAYGPLDNVRLVDLARPEPKRSQVRVRVRVAALNPADHTVAHGAMRFLHGRRMPLALGYDFAGTVDAVGADVSGHTVGQRGRRVRLVAVKPRGIDLDLVAGWVADGMTVDIGRVVDRDDRDAVVDALDAMRAGSVSGRVVVRVAP